jgi:uracil-DNA glycosylase family 4
MSHFDPECRLCPRLARHLAAVRKDFPEYHAKPVAPFGVVRPKLLIVGLAPGMHGANATGRPFTGDYAGILLYETLHKFGFASKPVSAHKNDGLRLIKCRITNAVKCLPPENKPVVDEINTCNRYLAAELKTLAPGSLILALGTIAHNAVVQALGLKKKDHPFGHGHLHALAGQRWLLDSYHCSRYNTQTRRLTEKMFHEIFMKIHEILYLSD